MDGTRFDTLIRSLTGEASRRGVLRGVVGGVAGALTGLLGHEVVQGSKRQMRRHANRQRRGDTQVAGQKRKPGKCKDDDKCRAGGVCFNEECVACPEGYTLCPDDGLCYDLQTNNCHCADPRVSGGSPCGGQCAGIMGGRCCGGGVCGGAPAESCPLPNDPTYCTVGVSPHRA